MKCFVFDIDGTLIDTEYEDTESLRQVLLEETGREYEREDLRRYFGMASRDVLVDLGLEDTDSSILKKWNDTYCDMNQGNVRLFEGIEQVLEAIHSKNIPMGIVTSRNRKEFEEAFARLPLRKYFHLSVDADLTKRHKPFPDPLDKFFELSELSKQDAIFIGDSRYDWECAKSSGVTFGLAGWGCENPEGIYPDHYFRQPYDMLNLL